MRPLAAVFVAAFLSVAPVDYLPPVDAPVLDPFRPPAEPWAAGNRGLEYDTVPGQPVRAAAAGTVVFAGRVAQTLHVTILHADGLRTSYSYLATITVVGGRQVAQGAVVGTTSERPFFFSVRSRDAYLDPAVLFAATGATVRLVPEAGTGAATPRAASATVAGPAVAWARDGDATAPARSCTPPGSAPVPAPEGRRIAVLVGGLGSTSEHASVDDVDTGALGYAPGDVIRFSYAGGRTPDPTDGLSRVSATTYVGADTGTDLPVVGRRLAALVTAVAREAPDATVDVIAHSLGGIVVRVALHDLGDEALGALGVVVTLGSPHQGADLASLVGDVERLPGGEFVLDLIAWLDDLGLAIGAPALAQIAVGSPLLEALAAAGLPPGVAVLSIAARADLVVPARRSELPGAANVVVSVPGWSDHADLPAAGATTREVALAIAGAPPSCEGLVDRLTDAVVAGAVAVGSALLEWLVPG